MKNTYLLKLPLVLLVYTPLSSAEMNRIFYEANTTFYVRNNTLIFNPGILSKRVPLSVNGGGGDGGGDAGDDGSGGFRGSLPFHYTIVQAMNGKEKEKPIHNEADNSSLENQPNKHIEEGAAKSEPDAVNSGTGFEPPFRPNDNYNSLEDVEDLLQQIETMMMSLPEGEEVVMISDLDDTLITSNAASIPEQDEIKVKFACFFERMRLLNKIRLVVVTLNRSASNKDFFHLNNLPEPDYLISGCFAGGPVVVRAAYSHTFLSEVMPGYPCCKKIKLQDKGFHLGGVKYGRIFKMYDALFLEELFRHQDIFPFTSMALVDGFESVDDPRAEWKYAIVVDKLFDVTDETNIKEINSFLFNMFGALARFYPIDTLGQFGISFPNNKAAFINRFARAMKLEGTHILVTGDDHPDLSMMTLDEEPLEYQITESVVVNNADDSMKEEAERRSIYIAKRKYLPGVLEGLHRMLKKLMPES